MKSAECKMAKNTENWPEIHLETLTTLSKIVGITQNFAEVFVHRHCRYMSTCKTPAHSGFDVVYANASVVGSNLGI